MKMDSKMLSTAPTQEPQATQALKGPKAPSSQGLMQDLSVLVALCSALLGALSTALTWATGGLLELVIGRVPFIFLFAWTMLANSVITGLLMFWLGRKQGLQVIDEGPDASGSPTE